MDKEKDNKNKNKQNEKIEKAVQMAEFVKEYVDETHIYFERLKKYLDEKSKEKKEQRKICIWLLQNPEEANLVIGETKTGSFLWVVGQYMSKFEFE